MNKDNDIVTTADERRPFGGTLNEKQHFWIFGQGTYIYIYIFKYSYNYYLCLSVCPNVRFHQRPYVYIIYIYGLYCCSLIECIRSRCLNHLVHSMKTFQIDGCFRLGTTPSTCIHIYTCSFFVIGLEMVQSHSLSFWQRHTQDSSNIKTRHICFCIFIFLP